MDINYLHFYNFNEISDVWKKLSILNHKPIIHIDLRLRILGHMVIDLKHVRVPI